LVHILPFKPWAEAGHLVGSAKAGDTGEILWKGLGTPARSVPVVTQMLPLFKCSCASAYRMSILTENEETARPKPNLDFFQKFPRTWNFTLA
jgi:hypothetical protein